LPIAVTLHFRFNPKSERIVYQEIRKKRKPKLLIIGKPQGGAARREAKGL
jgi:hypothetical protein